MKTKFVLLIILFTLWLAQLAFTSTKVLIIGVGNFDDNRVIQLDGAVKDAKDFRDTIISLGLAKTDDVLFLENPTLAVLNANIRRWFTNAEPQDKLIFYYSGHGYSKDGKTYLIPKDVDPSFIEDTGYNLTENLSKLLAQTRANEVIVIMDACYSGGIVKDRPLGGIRVETMSLEEVAKQKGTVFLLSSKPDEISQEKPTGGGWFTHYLLEGLKGEAGKGKEFITTKDLYQYVAQAVSKQTYGKQNPLIIGTKEIVVTVNLKEQQRKLVHELVDLALDGKIPEDYIYRYVKVLTQSESKDSDLEKKIRAILQKYANDKNLEALKLQTKILLGDGDGSTPPPPPPVKGTCLLKIIAENDLAKTAKIFLDNVEKGDLSKGIFELIDLAVRKYILVIDGEKIERYEKEIQFTHEYEVQEIKFTASVPTRPVRIQTEPTGAKVFIDGKEVGVSTWQGKLEVGKIYEIKLIKEGYRDEVRKIHIPTKGELMTIPVTLSQNKAPELPKVLTPMDGEKDVKTEVTLKWESKDPEGDEVTYDLYLGTNPNPPLLAKDLKVGEYKVTGLSGNTTYYWKVIAKDNFGAIREGLIIKFTTQKPLLPPGTVKWKTKVGNYCWSPIILGDSIYVTRRYGGELIRLTKSGEIQWRFKAGGDYSTFVAADLNNTLYFGSTDTYVYAVTTDGKLKWKFKTNDSIISSPGIGKDGTIYIGSEDGYLYAINPDGTLKWKVKTGTIGYSSPSIDSNGTIYIGGAWNRVFYAVNPDGTIKWNVTLDGTIGSSISFDRNGRIYIGSDASYVYCFDQNGKLIWKTNFGAGCIGEPTISESGLLYISTWEHGKSIPILSQDGKILKKVPIEGNSVACATIGNDGKAYVLSTDGYLYALTPEGNILWKLLIGKDSWDSPALDTDGTLYVGSSDGYLYAIQTDSYGLADSPWPKARGNVRNTGRFGDK